jgi:hypothetical protein
MHALLIGCGLVVVILVVFLFDWRTALISMTAIPLSLMAAALVLHFAGATMNTMVIAGLVIALGEVVDDAIIDVENILRRLRLNREAEQPESAFTVVLNASLEVRSAVVDTYLPRLEPGASVLAICTRWAVEDLFGHFADDHPIRVGREQQPENPQSCLSGHRREHVRELHHLIRTAPLRHSH